MSADVFPDCLWASERRLASLGGDVSGEGVVDALGPSGAAGTDGVA
jgi:hypothetical protein